MISIGSITGNVAQRIAGYAKNWVIRDYEEYCITKPSRRALLSYLVLPLLPPPRFRDRIKFSNRGIAQEIPKVLNKLGYSVDIVNYDNRSWLPDREYDLFIGHGGINFERISRNLPNRTIHIYFATGIYWKEWNRNNNNRVIDFISRKVVNLKSYREIINNEEYALNISDGIICLGNCNAINTYKEFPRVIGINNAIYPVSWGGWRSKNYEEGKKHFLFFSGRGNVHKGLDLLLEAFAGTDFHLHVCQHMEQDFYRAYQQELTCNPNIHMHGFVPMRSTAFYKLAQQSNWVISPTCAEGQPGAVLECMGHGLIPIISKEANIDIGEWGILLPDCNITTLFTTISNASHMDTVIISDMASKVYKITNDLYSVDLFQINLLKAIKSIL